MFVPLLVDSNACGLRLRGVDALSAQVVASRVGFVVVSAQGSDSRGTEGLAIDGDALDGGAVEFEMSAVGPQILTRSRRFELLVGVEE